MVNYIQHFFNVFIYHQYSLLSKTFTHDHLFKRCWSLFFINSTLKFADVFFYSVACFFFKLLIFMMSGLSIFLFMDCAFSVKSNNFIQP